MQLRNGTNTISGARLNAESDALRYAQWDDQMKAAAGRAEEMPSEMADRHERQWQQLREDYQNLSVQEWLKRYPDPPDIKQRERYWSSEISAGKASSRAATAAPGADAEGATTADVAEKKNDLRSNQDRPTER